MSLFNRSHASALLKGDFRTANGSMNHVAFSVNESDIQVPLLLPDSKSDNVDTKFVTYCLGDSKTLKKEWCRCDADSLPQ